MISLAVARFKLSELQVIAQLEHGGIIKPLQNPQLFLDRRRRRLMMPYENSRNLMDVSTRGGKIVINNQAAVTAEKIGLKVESAMSWAPDTTGKLIGWADADRIEEGFQIKYPFGQGSVRKYHNRRICPVSIEYAFVLPFYDLPGRVANISLLLPNSRNVWQFVEASVKYANANGPYVSGGIFTHPSVFDSPAGSSIVLTDNLELAVRMHVKQFNRGFAPLQLACYNDSHISTTDWQILSGKELVFWTSSMDPKVFAKAVSADGKIASNRSDVGEASDYVDNVAPTGVIKSLVERAKPWQACIEIIAEKWPNDRILAFVSKANLSPEMLHKVLNAFPSGVRSRLKRALDTDSPFRSLQTSKGRVEQRTSGWFHVDDKGEEMIIGAPFRLTHAVTQETGNDLAITYRGETRFRNRVIPFTIDKETFHSKPLKTIHDVIVKSGAGVPAYNPKYESIMGSIVLQFSSPEVVSGVSRFGYDHNNCSFVTPKGSFVGGTREIRGVDCDEEKQPLENVCVPFSRFLVRNAKKTWTSAHIAAARQLTIQLLSPVSGDVLNLFHSGSTAGLVVSEVVGWLGLDTVSGNVVTNVDKLTTKHALPVSVDLRTRISKQVLAEIFNHRSTTCVAKVNHATMLYATVAKSGLSLVSAPDDVYSPANDACLWGVLKEAIHNTMLACNNGNRPTIPVIASFVDNAFKKEFGAAEFNSAITSHVINDAHNTDAARLALTATWLVGVGRMAISRYRGHMIKRRAIYKDVREGRAYIPCVDFTQAIREAGAPHPVISIDLPKIEIDSVPCWVVPVELVNASVEGMKNSYGALKVFTSAG
jgi:hypothetical protein